MKKKLIALLISAAMLLTVMPAAVFADEAPADDYATRGEVCDMLLTAADDYNPGVQKTDILKGYEDGLLHEDWSVTRAEALVMLKRAFGEIPEIEGANEYIAFPAETFTDIPDWAETELSDVFDSGIVAGKAEGIFAPDDNVTTGEMELFIERMYRVFGTNLKDNYYQTVNHDALDSAVIPDGEISMGTMSGFEVQDQIKDIVKGVAASDPDKNSKEGKIKTLYDNYMNKEVRNAQGYEPIKPYLDEIDAMKSVSDLVNCKEAMEIFARFEIGYDDKDSTHYADFFSTPTINTKEMYEGKNENQKAASLKYAASLLKLIGYSEAEAEAAADRVFDIEKQVAEASLSLTDTYDINKTYNIYSLDEISALFKNVDINKVFENSGLKNKDRFIVYDVGAMEKTAELLDDKNLEAIKDCAKINILKSYDSYLSDDFDNAYKTFVSEVYGIQGESDDETDAVNCVDGYLSDYLGELYTDKYMDEKTKTDVTQIIKDMIDIYRERIQKLDWLSDATKQKAIKKLDTMGIKVGGPDKLPETTLDSTELKSYADGGSLVENIMAINDAAEKDDIKKEGGEVDHTEWIMSPQTVNACYNPSFNDITITAAILQIPHTYSSSASYEENLGGIGIAIGHELSHAFDKSGSQYDENGNAVNWWTDEDAAAFEERCKAVIGFYDGQESAPGITTNGELTLTENTADMGGLSVATELASKIENFDYKKMFETWAQLWMNVSYRGYLEQLAVSDVHSAAEVRVNRLFETSDKFFETYGITENDGMWVPPEDRVSIW